VAPSGARLVVAPIDGTVAALPLPSDAPVAAYRLQLDRPDGSTSTLGRIPVGREYELESFPIPLEEAPAPNRQPPAWVLYEQSIYQRHQAARTNRLEAVRRPIAPLPPGRYVVFVRVFEDPYPLANVLEVRFGGAAASVMWSGQSNQVRWISNPIETTVIATDLELAPVRVEQNWLIVDAVRIYPAP
jgi:hypothetical protein